MVSFCRVKRFLLRNILFHRTVQEDIHPLSLIYETDFIKIEVQINNLKRHTINVFEYIYIYILHLATSLYASHYTNTSNIASRHSSSSTDSGVLYSHQSETRHACIVYALLNGQPPRRKCAVIE